MVEEVLLSRTIHLTFQHVSSLTTLQVLWGAFYANFPKISRESPFCEQQMHSCMEMVGAGASQLPKLLSYPFCGQ